MEYTIKNNKEKGQNIRGENHDDKKQLGRQERTRAKEKQRRKKGIREKQERAK